MWGPDHSALLATFRGNFGRDVINDYETTGALYGVSLLSCVPIVEQDLRARLSRPCGGAGAGNNTSNGEERSDSEAHMYSAC